MYKWLEDIDLSNLNEQFENLVSHLVDPIWQVIPEDAVFVAYRNLNQIKLMSANSLEHMLNQMEESRQFIATAPQDKSAISLVVQESDTDKSYEAEYKKMLQLLVEKGKNKAEISMICNALNGGLIMAHMVAEKDEKAALGIVTQLKMISDPDLSHSIDTYWNMLQLWDKSAGFKLLPQYFEELITQQAVDLETHRKKLRDKEGNDLGKQEVICAITREVINVSHSMETQTNASKFLMLVVALAQLSKTKNNELDDFTSAQHSGYINECFELLQTYVRAPQQFSLKAQQHEFLNKLGMDKVLKQWHEHCALTHCAEKKEDKELLEPNDSELNNEKPNYSPGQSCRFFKLQPTTKEGTANTFSYMP